MTITPRFPRTARRCRARPRRPRRGRSVARRALALGWLLGAAACAPHRVDPQPAPVVEPPDAYPSLAAHEPPTPDTPRRSPEPWWRELAEPQLDALVRLALQRAFDVDVAFARLTQARARAVQVGAPLRPQVDAFAAADLVDFDGDSDTRFAAGLVASWELDLFGRLRARRAAALEDAAAAEADLAGLRLALSADVADTWLLALEQRLQLELLVNQLALDRTLLELTEFRFAQGSASAVDVLQQQGQVAATQSLIPPARAARRRAENRLDVLLGLPPDGEDRVLAADFPELPPLPEVGVPADLLLRRPDLRALLAVVAGDDQRVAAAVADRFPRLLITGSLALEGGSGDDGLASALGAELLAPLTDGGLRRAVVAENEARLRESVARLSNAFLGAVEEVDNALWLERQQREELVILERRAAVLTDNVIEARNRYANGLTDYLPVFVAVNAVQETQRDVLERRRALLSRRVALHRALGGALPPAEADA